MTGLFLPKMRDSSPNACPALTRVMAASTPVGSGLAFYFMQVTPGRHHIETTGSQPLGIKLYGVAPYTSYMYPGGLNLDPISPPG